jgi:polyhydroxyalkanoate synthesis repressor PhaR
MTDRIDDAAQGDTAENPRNRAKIIKRYSNRKLYDTERSKYVTLDEIARMIKAGEEVTIIDNETKEDLTSVTLTQIIFEEEKRESRMPLGMLRNLIQTGGDALQEFFDRSVKTPVSEIQATTQKTVEELKQGAVNLREAATRSVTEWTDTALRVFTRDAEAKRAEEFKKAYTASFDELAARISARTKDVVSTREHNTAETAKAAQAAAEGNGTPVPNPDVAVPRVIEDCEAMRAKLAEIATLVDELERSGR